MYISDITHFLDEAGNIAKPMPKEARELACFLVLIIDETTNFDSESGFETGIRCFKKRCEGLIRSEILLENNNEIHWLCSKCNNEGIISGWENCRWDNS